MSQSSSSRRVSMRRSLIALAISSCLMSASPLFAQSNTTGSIFGQAGEGSTVTVVNKDTGFTRTVSADSSGRYRAGDLPPGRYDVTIQSGG